MVLRNVRISTLALLGMIFLCVPAFANYTSPLVKMTTGGDATITFLGKIFGSVNNSLNGGVDGLAALLFKIFNVAILIFGSVFTGITVTQSVIQTAAQGVFMGKKGSQASYFTMIRTISGLACVVPKFNGYCLAQIFVMSIVIKSTTFAGNIAHHILESSMRSSPEVYFEPLMNKLGTSASPSTGMALYNSRLSNRTVQQFYKAVIRGSVCAVEYNRAQSAPFRSSSQLYEVSNGKINFLGCGSLNLNFNVLSGLSSSLMQSYKIVLEDGISHLIDPVMTAIFYRLPSISPTTSSQCFTVQGCSSGTVQTQSRWITQVKEAIELGHDNFAPNFALTIPGSAPSNFTGTGEGGKDFLYDWFDFPILYQTVMDVKSQGLYANSLQELMELSVRDDSSTETTMSLSQVVNGLGRPNSTLYDSEINNLRLESRVASSGATAQYLRDKNTLEARIRSYLSTLRYTPYPSSSSSPQRLIDIWMTEDYDYFDEGAASFDHAVQRLANREASERALKNPVDSFLFYSAEKWIDIYLRNTAQIILSPARKLGEAAAFMGGQATLFMFTTMRNVMADQILRSYNIFWTFFGTKIAMQLSTAYTSLAQQHMWDWSHCLTTVPPQPLFGTNARHPICSPMMTIAPPPIFIMMTPTYPVELATSSSWIGVITGTNVAMHVADTVLEKFFQYVYFLSAQYEYAYYGYIAAATVPVMIVSNLLAVWIPMLPSLIFYVSIVGWLFAVIESMIAAPLVVLGLAFPQGHDLLGSSQQMLALLLGVFLRAPLIVIGFFMGMLMLSIAISALSIGLVPLALQLFTSSSPTQGDGFLMYAFMIIILYVTGTLLMQAMSITYKLPNKILLWVGGQPQDGVEEEAMQAIQGLVNQQQTSALQSIGQAASAAKSGGDGVSQEAGGGFEVGKSMR